MATKAELFRYRAERSGPKRAPFVAHQARPEAGSGMDLVKPRPPSVGGRQSRRYSRWRMAVVAQVLTSSQSDTPASLSSSPIGSSTWPSICVR